MAKELMGLAGSEVDLKAILEKTISPASMTYIKETSALDKETIACDLQDKIKDTTEDRYSQMSLF